MNRTITAVSTCLCLTGFSLICQATELVYTPVNPNFGGNPLNGPTLLNEAQAQNDYKDPDLKRSTTTATSALERFSQHPQRQHRQPHHRRLHRQCHRRFGLAEYPDHRPGDGRNFGSKRQRTYLQLTRAEVPEER